MNQNQDEDLLPAFDSNGHLFLCLDISRHKKGDIANIHIFLVLRLVDSNVLVRNQNLFSIDTMSSGENDEGITGQ